nr:MAG TPA: hypothetical protein [Caudoviricetes sp.]
MQNRDFDHLVLTFREEWLLRQSKKRRISVHGAERLLRHALVKEHIRAIPGYMGKPSGFASITESGIDYLLFVSSRRKANYLIPIVVSILTNIAISALQSLWPLIKAWIEGWFPVS